MKYHGNPIQVIRLGGILHYRSYIALTSFLLIICILPTQAQVRQSPTPIIVNLITPTPFVQQSVATVTPTFTATSIGPVLLEVRQEAGSVNVRTEPGPNADRLGSISNGTQYPVYRQFFSWYEIQYDLSPNGRGWVFGELVDIIGDAIEIEVIESFNWATPQAALNVVSTSTPELSEGDILTATANARVLEVPTSIDTFNSDEIILDATPLPTYTYPPDIVAQVPTQNITIVEQPVDVSLDQIPPLLPIVLLGGFGIIGLLLNSLRG